jgi:glycosyltransferase involved in cell wall biosynthesis
MSSHPEIASVIEELCKQKSRFELVSKIYLMPHEKFILVKLFGRSKLLRGWIQKMLVIGYSQNYVAHRVAVIETFAARLSQHFRFESAASYFSKRSDQKFEKSAAKIGKLFTGEKIIYDQTFNVALPKSKMKICIAYHGHPFFVHFWTKRAHEWDSKEKFHDPYSEEITIGLREADTIVVLSEFSKRGFLENGFSQNQVFSIPIGPINRNKSKGIAESRLDIKSVLSVGRPIASKGLITFLSVLSKSASDFDFHLFGSYSHEAASILDEYIKNYDLEVRFGAAAEDICNAYSKFDVFLFPSYYEGFGIALLESMSFGMIPIASKNSIAMEIFPGTLLEDYLVDPGSTAQILEKLYYLSSLSQSKVLELRAEARRLSMNYSFENFASLFFETLLR